MTPAESAAADIRSIGDLVPHAETQQRASAGQVEFWRYFANGIARAVLITQLIRAGLSEDRAAEEARKFTQAADTLSRQWAAVNRAATALMSAHDELLAAANRADIRIG